MTTYSYDPTGESKKNLITDEVHGGIVEPILRPTNGLFYAGGFRISGATKDNPTLFRNLISYADYLMSPVFETLSLVLNKSIYSYVLLTNYDLWDSIKITYHAVGGELEDKILEDKILGLTEIASEFDRTSLSAWLTLPAYTDVITNVKDVPSVPYAFSSNSITTANVAQELVPAHSAGYNFEIFNTDATHKLYISLTGTASANSIPILPGNSYASKFNTLNAVSVFGTTQGQTFTGHYW